MNIREIPWYCFESLVALYTYSQSPEFEKESDADNILKWMKSCESIRPEDLSKPLDRSMWS